MTSRLKRLYFQKVKEELGDNLYSKDTVEKGSQWTHCYFMSKRRPVVYMLCLSTATFELKRTLKKLAHDAVFKLDPFTSNFSKQSSELLAEERQEMKFIHAEKDVNIFQKCVKIHTGGLNHEILKGVINVDKITHRVIKQFVSEFLEDEIFWQTSEPVKFSEAQLRSIF